MPIPYQNTGPVDCTVVPDLGTLKDKSVIVTGGLYERQWLFIGGTDFRQEVVELEPHMWKLS
jgi:hypothetical protein